MLKEFLMMSSCSTHRDTLREVSNLLTHHTVSPGRCVCAEGRCVCLARHMHSASATVPAAMDMLRQSNMSSPPMSTLSAQTLNNCRPSPQAQSLDRHLIINQVVADVNQRLVDCQEFQQRLVWIAPHQRVQEQVENLPAYHPGGVLVET